MSRRRFSRTLVVACLPIVVIGTAIGCQRAETTPLAVAKANSFDPAHAKIEGPENNLFKLKYNFSFFDSKGNRWVAPEGTLTDGASIPQGFLSLIGDRFDRNYLDAAVVHDAYCGSENKGGASYQTKSWKDVHSMFYEACLASGSGDIKAKLMYAAVYLGGPRWDDPKRSLESVPPQALAREFERCKQWIEAENPTKERIDQWMDGAESRLIGGEAAKPSTS